MLITAQVKEERREASSNTLLLAWLGHVRLPYVLSVVIDLSASP
jgi:hypothetical protein